MFSLPIYAFKMFKTPIAFWQPVNKIVDKIMFVVDTSLQSGTKVYTPNHLNIVNYQHKHKKTDPQH